MLDRREVVKYVGLESISNDDAEFSQLVSPVSPV